MLLFVLVSMLASGWMPRALTARVYLPLSVLVVLLVIFDFCWQIFATCPMKDRPKRRFVDWVSRPVFHTPTRGTPRNPGFWEFQVFIPGGDGDGDDAVTGGWFDAAIQVVAHRLLSIRLH